MDASARAPRSSPAHLVYKFGCLKQQMLDLGKQLDAKNLSVRQRERLRAHLHELDEALWPEQPHAQPRPVPRAPPSAAPAAATGADPVAEAAAAAHALEAKVAQLEREFARREGRGTLLSSVHIHHREPASFRSYGNLFGRYFSGVVACEIREPYLESVHQVNNLWEFLEMAAQSSGGLLRDVVVYTQDSARAQRSRLALLVDRAASMGRKLEFRSEQRLHHREITTSTGIVIVSDRGLDLYEAPPLGLRRQPAGRAARLCRGGVVEIFSRDKGDERSPARRARPGRSGKRIVATPKLGRGSAPSLGSRMRQPAFDETPPLAADVVEQQLAEKQETTRRAALAAALATLERVRLQRLRAGFNSLEAEAWRVKPIKDRRKELQDRRRVVHTYRECYDQRDRLACSRGDSCRFWHPGDIVDTHGELDVDSDGYYPFRFVSDSDSSAGGSVGADAPDPSEAPSVDVAEADAEPEEAEAADEAAASPADSQQQQEETENEGAASTPDASPAGPAESHAEPQRTAERLARLTQAERERVARALGGRMVGARMILPDLSARQSEHSESVRPYTRWGRQF